MLKRPNGLARGIPDRLVADGRLSGNRISAEVQWRLNSLMSGRGYSAYQIVIGPNPADLFGWDDYGEDPSLSPGYLPFGTARYSGNCTWFRRGQLFRK